MSAHQSSEPILTLRGGRVRTGSGAVILDLPAVGADAVEVRAGEALVVLGPSGAGKSTLLRALAGLEPLDAGELAWTEALSADERAGTGRGQKQHRSATVFQNPALMPWLTVRQNIGLGLRYGKNKAVRSGETRAHSVDELLGLLGLENVAEQKPASLSGGQAQRAALGRALAIGPDVLFADEPFSALDPHLRGELAELLHGLVSTLGLGLVLVTHDLAEALQLADRILYLPTSSRTGAGADGANDASGTARLWDLRNADDARLAQVRVEASALFRAGAYLPEPITAGASAA